MGTLRLCSCVASSVWCRFLDRAHGKARAAILATTGSASITLFCQIAIRWIGFRNRRAPALMQICSKESQDVSGPLSRVTWAIAACALTSEQTLICLDLLPR
ncbi:hypothetical protein C8Q73DRAFT_229658 [Cubamyces lactineus]|nr:hypothetical protein C8Q73DRAFT_229658 [Cubamyces lactineus]